MTDRVTFVHAADLHLDAPFAGISATDERVGRALADATYEAFGRIVDVCIERGAQFLVIAGDAYNSADKSLRAQLAFRAQVERLAAVGIEVYVVHGNHDPASGWSAGLAMPETVHVFPADRVGRFEVVRDGAVVAAVYGRSYGRTAETANLALDYAREGTEPVAVAVLHANVGGHPEYDPYAPASLEDLRAARMDYWALGHIHKQEVLSRDPWVAYAGSPQGLTPNETGPHGCFVVEVSPGGAITAEHVETAPIVWASAAVDVSAVSGLDALRTAIAETCDGLRDDAGRPVVARVTLTGRSAIHADLARPLVLDQLADDVRGEQASLAPWLWLDRLVDHTSGLLDVAAIGSGADFAGEVVRIAAELDADRAALKALLDEIAGPLSAAIPGYALGIAPADAIEAARDTALDALLRDGGDRP